MSTPSPVSAGLASHAEPFTPVPGVTVPGLAADGQAVVGAGVVARSARPSSWKAATPPARTWTGTSPGDWATR